MRGAVAYFQGQFTHAVDAKGRLIIPASFRELLGDRVVLARGAIDPCIDAYPLETWVAISAAAQSMPLSSPAARRFNRMRFGHSAEVPFDGMGRVLLPSFLRERAGITDRAVIVGANGMFEIWNPDRFDEASERDFAESDATYQQTADKYGV